MNKKKLVAGLLASASVLGICLSGGTALAQEKDKQDTTVGIGFADHIPGTEDGPLKLQWVPKSLDFGSGHEVNTAQFVFPLKDTSEKYVVVSDTRADADRIQWKLTAKLSDLTSSKGNTLSGSSLEFDNTMMAYSGTESPSSTNVVAPIAGQQSATVTASVSLDAGATTAKEVMQDNGGGGTNSFNGKTATQLSNVGLKVPANKAVEKQTYTGKVTWSLDDTI